MASATGFYCGSVLGLRLINQENKQTSLKLNSSMNAFKTSRFSGREMKSPNRRLSRRVQPLRNLARLFGRSTVSERSA